MRTQLRKVAGMREDLACYERAKAGEPGRSYQFLLDCARKYVNRQRGEYNRQMLMQHLRGPDIAVPAAPDESQYKTTVCFYPKGMCQRGDQCPWSHAEVAGGKPLPTAELKSPPAKVGKSTAPIAPSQA